LATQNPVDLDYKGLSNTGTWFIGRLQTENDKNRVLEGLEGVAAGSDLKFDRQEMEETLAGLSSRIFLMNNVHDDGPEVFESRWAMSYLRGPLTRNQIKTLMEPIKQQASVGQTGAPAVTATAPATAPANVTGEARQPVLPPDLAQYFIPVRNRQADAATLVYQPHLIGAAEVRFSDKRVDTARSLTLLAPITDGVVSVDWDQARPVDLPVSDLETSPEPGAHFAALPAAGGKAKSYNAWQKELAGWLYRTQKLELLSSERLKQTSNPDESEQDFRLRLRQAAREQRDSSIEKLRQKYAPKVAALEERKRRAAQAVEREAEQSKSQKFQTAISFGATVLSSFLGRKSVSLSTLGRATTAARSVGRSMKEAQDVGRAEETVEALNEQLAELDAQFKNDTVALEQATDLQSETLGTLTLKPTKANIAIKHFSLAWAPFWQNKAGQATPAWE